MKDRRKATINVGDTVVYAENHMYACVDTGVVEKLCKEDKTVHIRSTHTDRINIRYNGQVLVVPKTHKYEVGQPD